jgi:inorganic pyrophosphatase
MKNKNFHLLSNLPAYREDDCVHAVVEAPKGSLVKLQFFLSTAFFTAKKPAILGWKGPKKATSVIKESSKSYLLEDA